jgi:two-component system, OmpR family, KDP operon response regulator KdpE
VTAPAALPIILVAAPETRTRKTLRSALAGQRMRVVEASTSAETLSQAAKYNPVMMVIEAGGPGFDGVQLTTTLREWTAAPILIVSALSEEHDKVAVLDAGANDYVTKPFVTSELLARVRVWLRQTQRAESELTSSILDVGDLRIDFEKRLAFVSGQEVRLTPTQYKLFGTMMRMAGRVLTHEQILFTVWGPAYTKETQYLRVYIGQLRHKFEKDPTNPRYFLTEPGIGYRLRG